MSDRGYIVKRIYHRNDWNILRYRFFKRFYRMSQYIQRYLSRMDDPERAIFHRAQLMFHHRLSEESAAVEAVFDDWDASAVYFVMERAIGNLKTALAQFI